MDKAEPATMTGTVIENQSGRVRVELDEVCSPSACAGCGRTCGAHAPRIVALAPGEGNGALRVGDRVAVRPPSGATAAALRLLCLPLAVFVIVCYLCNVCGFSEGVSALFALGISAATYVAMNRLATGNDGWLFSHRIYPPEL